MIKIKSLNCASYVTTVTGEIAEISIEENGMTSFNFNEKKEIKSAINMYRNCVSNNKELNADLIKFIGNIRDYKAKSNKFKSGIHNKKPVLS